MNNMIVSTLPLSPNIEHQETGLAIEDVFSQYREKLFLYFMKLTNRNAFDSDDLVQTVFLKLVINQRKYTGSGSFQAWLFSIARNCGRDYYRKKNIEGWLEENSTINLIDPIFQQFDQQEEIEFLHSALSLLKPRDREIITLSTFQCLSHKKIAAILGISEGAARTRQHRAVKNLRIRFFTLVDIAI